MEFLRIFLRVLGISLYAYTGLVAIFFILTWIRSLYGTKFFNFMNKIASPFEAVFGGKLVAGGFDIGGTIGLFMLVFISQFLVRLSYNI